MEPGLEPSVDHLLEWHADKARSLWTRVNGALSRNPSRSLKSACRGELSALRSLSPEGEIIEPTASGAPGEPDFGSLGG